MTLNIREPKITAERSRYKYTQMTRIFLPVSALCGLSFLVTFMNFYVLDSGHPMLLITSGLNFAILAALFVSHKCHIDLGALPFDFYYVVHAVSVILVYNEWLPEQLCKSKFELQYQNIVNYVLIMCVPVHSFGRTFCLLTPLFLYTAYVQAQYEA